MPSTPKNPSSRRRTLLSFCSPTKSLFDLLFILLFLFALFCIILEQQHSSLYSTNNDIHRNNPHASTQASIPHFLTPNTKSSAPLLLDIFHREISYLHNFCDVYMHTAAHQSKQVIDLSRFLWIKNIPALVLPPPPLSSSSSSSSLSSSSSKIQDEGAHNSPLSFHIAFPKQYASTSIQYRSLIRRGVLDKDLTLDVLHILSPTTTNTKKNSIHTFQNNRKWKKKEGILSIHHHTTFDATNLLPGTNNHQKSIPLLITIGDGIGWLSLSALSSQIPVIALENDALLKTSLQLSICANTYSISDQNKSRINELAVVMGMRPLHTENAKHSMHSMLLQNITNRLQHTTATTHDNDVEYTIVAVIHSLYSPIFFDSFHNKPYDKKIIMGNNESLKIMEETAHLWANRSSVRPTAIAMVVANENVPHDEDIGEEEEEQEERMKTRQRIAAIVLHKMHSYGYAVRLDSHNGDVQPPPRFDALSRVLAKSSSNSLVDRRSGIKKKREGEVVHVVWFTLTHS